MRNFVCLLVLPLFMLNCDIIVAESQEVLKKHISKQYLNAHNKVRKSVGIPPLVWDKKLAKFAKKWTNKLAEDCLMEHSKNTGYGENLAKNWGSRVLPAKKVVGMWASERKNYNHKNNSCKDGKVCGHYTQIVWKKTKKVGCAYTVCKNYINDPVSFIYACEYQPPGNYTGQRPY